MQLPKSQRFPGRGHRVGLVKLLDVVTASGTPAELCPTVRAREGILHVHAEVLLEQRPRFEHLRAEGARERVGRVVARRRRGERRPGRRTGADPLPGSRYDAPHGTMVVRRRLSPCALCNRQENDTVSDNTAVACRGGGEITAHARVRRCANSYFVLKTTSETLFCKHLEAGFGSQSNELIQKDTGDIQRKKNRAAMWTFGYRLYKPIEKKKSVKCKIWKKNQVICMCENNQITTNNVYTFCWVLC